MKNTINFFTLVLTILFSAESFAQSPVGTYRISNYNLVGNLKKFDIGTGKCGTDTYNAAAGAVVEVVREINAGADYVVSIYIINNDSTNTVDFTEYCISKADLLENNYFRPYSRVDYGILAIPYKMRFDPFTIFPGGTLGAYVGRKFNPKNFSNSVILFAGLSTVPLNSSTSDVVDVRPGVSSGLGWIWYVAKDFQIGFISGVDLFDGVETWSYKYQPWLSFNIGYSFATQ